MMMRLLAGLILSAAATAGVCSAADANPAPARRAAEARSEGGHEEADAAERLNPINFRGLNFRGDLAIWTAVVFLVVLAILWKFAWRPIAEGLERREQNIADNIAEAEAANNRAEQLLAEYRQKLDEAEGRVRGILDQGRRQAEQLGRDLIEKAKKDAELEHQRAVQRIEAAADDALKDLADRGAAMAVELAGRIVGEKIDPEQHTRLIEQTVKGMVKE